MNRRWLLVLLAVGVSLGAWGDARQAQPYSTYVRGCLDTLMAHGRDVYGPKETPILVSILDVETRQCPEEPEILDEPWRVIRRHRRNPAGADLSSDMATLSVMRQLGGAYADFAREYAGYYLRDLPRKRDLLCWGWHEYYDVFTDKCHWDQHEVQAIIDPIDWDLLWEADAKETRRELEAIWKWHVIDKETGEINRHGDGKRGCDFSMSAGSYIVGFAFAHEKTGDAVWLERAKLLANYYWNNRNPETDLFAERPNAGTERFDGGHFVTACTGPYCGALLRAYTLTKEPLFLKQALVYLRAYARYGYDNENNAYWGSLRLDGTPNNAPRALDDYAKYEPRGHLDLWKPYILGYQHPLLTASSYVEAYRVSQDPVMLEQARRFGDWVLRERPGKGGIQENSWYGEYAKTWAPKGTYAGRYGRAVSLLLDLHEVTGESRYLTGAHDYANEAVSKLYHNNLFRGHPAKPYYEAVDGVGLLLKALIELNHTSETDSATAYETRPIPR